MAHRSTIYAQRIRQELIELMGNKCVDCGEDDPDKLEFDHINGRDYNPNKLSYSARMARYRREATATPPQIQLCCGTCNLKRRKKYENGAYCRTEEDPGPKTAEMPEVEGNPF